MNKTRAKLRFLATSITKQVCMSSSSISPREQRCLRLFHVKTLSITIAIIEILFILSQTALSISQLSSSTATQSALSSSIYLSLLILSLIAIILLLSAILLQMPLLLVPHLLMQALVIITVFGLALFALYTLLCGTSIELRIMVSSIDIPSPIWKEGRSDVSMVMISKALIGVIIIVALSYILLGVINIWTFHVVLDCYRWLTSQLEEKTLALSNITPSRLPPIKSVEDGTDL